VLSEDLFEKFTAGGMETLHIPTMNAFLGSAWGKPRIL
jgi:hypothetical protein